MSFERISPGTREWQAYYANHIFRYQFVGQKLSKTYHKTVLDAACGVGYGAFYLAELISSEVVAVDRCKKALSTARMHYAHPNLRYLEDDCQTLINASLLGPFDAIVSMETLEHLAKPDAFLDACFRLLKEDGALIVSTPNAAVTSPGGSTNWEYHEKEYTIEELTDILKKSGFNKVEIVGQSYTAIGRLRNSMRSELNRLYSNPFARAGRLMQKLIRRRNFPAVLAEQVEDFVMIDQEDFENNPPFVLIAIASK